jgi:hypothetical protein
VYCSASLVWGYCAWVGASLQLAHDTESEPHVFFADSHKRDPASTIETTIETTIEATIETTIEATIEAIIEATIETTIETII